MTENRLCGMAMLHIHRNDDVGHIECFGSSEALGFFRSQKVALTFDKA